HVIAAPDLSLLKVDEFPDGIPYSSSRIAVVDTQIFILPYGSNEAVSASYDELLSTIRTKPGANVQPATGWGSEPVYSYALLATLVRTALSPPGGEAVAPANQIHMAGVVQDMLAVSGPLSGSTGWQLEAWVADGARSASLSQSPATLAAADVVLQPADVGPNYL